MQKAELLESVKRGYFLILEPTVEFALRRENLREGFLEYLAKVVGKETGLVQEVAAIKQM